MNGIKIQAKKYFIFLLCFIIIMGLFPWQTKNLYGFAAEQNQIASSVTHGYVTDISFPQTTSISQNIQGYTFSPQQGDYDIVLLDSRNTAFSISISDKYFGNNVETQLGYNVYIDGKIQKISNKTNPQLLSKETTSCVGATVLLKASKFKVGEKHILSIKVGELTNQKDEYVDDKYDVYNFNITRGLTLNTLSATDENDTPCIITPDMSNRNTDPYENAYGMVCSGNNAVLKLTATTDGTTITVNGQEVTAGKTTIENWRQYVKAEEHFADIPIQLDYNVGDAKAETRIYTLRITEQNYQPVITKQPETMSVEKQEQKSLSVEVSTPEVGILSYQWYRSVSKNNNLSDYKKIKGATESCYQPDTKYARSLFYYCKVTNTVGSVKYTVDSAVAEVTTKKTYLTAPEFITQPTVTQSGSRIFFKNGVPDIEVGVIKPFNTSTGRNYIEGVEYQFTIYRNSVDSFDGAEQIGANFNMFTTEERTEPSTGEQYSVYKATLDPQDIMGTWYYFVKVTVAESGYDDDSCISNSLKLTFKDTTDVVKELEGSGTKSDPFLVYNEKDLLYVKSLVEGKDGEAFSFSGQIIAFANDIELSKEWSPIGNIKVGGDERDKGKSLQPFSGTIDGKNHTLTVADHGKSLLNYARKATVKNLNIKGEHIDGYGLLERYVVDYGPNGIYENNPVRLRVIDVENVTIKAGTKILESGFLGGYASGANACNIRNCKVEAGVIIGYDKTKTKIGSFAGDFNGTLENCISYATVYGVDCVGGLLGTKGQSMGIFVAVNSAFLGKIEASGKVVGGIAGGGYIAASAPGTPTAEIHNCYVDAQISAGDQVGGIIGSEAGHHTYNDKGDIYGVKGALSISDNIFVGKIKSSGSYIGGIIGCVYDFTKTSGAATNYYLDSCGAKSGIGGAISGKVTGAERHSVAATAEEFANETILNKLNQSDSSYKNWIQSDKYPIISEKKVVTGISIDGEYQNKYTIGETLNLKDATIYAIWSDGEKKQLSEDEIDKIEIQGYDSGVHGTQNVTLKYGGAKTEITVTVLKPDNSDHPQMMTVSFTLMGDGFHDSDEDKTVHTLENNNLQFWFEGKYTVSINATVKDVFEKALTAEGYTWRNTSGNYVQGITAKGASRELAELTNGPNSGWMYTLNGVHPQWGVAEQYLEPNAKIIFHYTDDYYYEPDTKDWISSGSGTVEEVNSVTTDTKTGTTTAPTDVKVSEKTNADGTKTKVADVKVSSDNQKEILKQAKEKKSNEIILVVSSKSVEDATKADVTLDKSFIDSIVKDTDAKLTVKTPFGDKTYTQEELKAMSGAATGSTITVAIEKAEQPVDNDEEKVEKAKALTKDMKLVARSAKTAKKNVKAVLKSDAKVKASIKELKDLGFTVKYRFYRSTKKAASYKSTVTNKAATYTNTVGKKGTKYFYKLQVRVYDENGKLIAKTSLKQCKYASRTWSK